MAVEQIEESCTTGWFSVEHGRGIWLAWRCSLRDFCFNRCVEAQHQSAVGIAPRRDCWAHEIEGFCADATE